MFAKLYGDDDDQVLVKVDSNVDGRPEIRFFCQPEGFGVCSLAVAFTDDDAGWEKAEKALRETTGMKTKTKGAGMSERQCRCFYHGSDLDGHCAGAAGFELPPERHPLEVFDRIGGGIPDPAGAARRGKKVLRVCGTCRHGGPHWRVRGLASRRTFLHCGHPDGRVSGAATEDPRDTEREWYHRACGHWEAGG